MHWKPTLLCEPSQKGRFSLAPQRHKETAGLPVRSHSLPSASLNTIGPSTRSGPFCRTVIFTDSDIFPHARRLDTGKPSIAVDVFSQRLPKQPDHPGCYAHRAQRKLNPLGIRPLHKLLILNRSRRVLSAKERHRPASLSSL